MELAGAASRSMFSIGDVVRDKKTSRIGVCVLRGVGPSPTMVVRWNNYESEEERFEPMKESDIEAVGPWYTLVHADPKITIREFAQKNGLEMVVTDRGEDSCFSRYTAQFKRAEVKLDLFLTSFYGEGMTPEEAINKYASNIRGRVLVIDAYRETRRKIQVPHDWAQE